MERLMKMVVAEHHVQDDDLLKVLEGNAPTENEKFFRKCLTGRFPQSAKYLIKKDRDENKLDRTLSSLQEPSIIFEAQEEEVAIEIMKTYNKESWKSTSVIHGTEENLLHFFIAKKFEKALLEILGNESIQEDIRELCFQSNAAQKIPLMTILSQEMEDAAMTLFKFMEKSGTNANDEAGVINQELESVLRQEDKRKDNIFHMCSSNAQNKLLLAICESSVVSNRCIQDGLVEENSNGRTPLDLCKDEDTLLNIFSTFDHTTHKVTWTDNEGKNILHHYARMDFDRVIGDLIKKLPSVEIRDMILQGSSSNGSNVLMTAATHSSRKTLELLLYFLSVFQFIHVDNGAIDMDHILHHRNEYGNTLLSLVLQHKDALQVPKIVLLGMENEFHSRQGQGHDLTCCFHKNLKPSGDVLRAIQEVERSKKKGTVAVVWIWIQSFLKAFLIPVGIMTMDVLFDVFLVREYYHTNQDCLTAQWIGCHSLSTFDTICGPNTTERAPQGDGMGFFCVQRNSCNELNTSQAVQLDGLNIFCIPLKLDARPRFLYSLGFVIWPWVYYVVEFLQSDVCQKMRQVSEI